jgi:cation:H+ antiporter
MTIWVQFLVLGAVILVAGTNLSKYGDVIAEKTGMGRTWIGVILMASITSLPELITGLSSVTVVNVPNIAVGDILGSCMFNLLLIAVVDALCRSCPATTRANPAHVLAAAFGALLLGLISLSIAAGSYLPSLGWVDLTTPLMVGLYLLAMRLVFLYGRRQPSIPEAVEELRYAGVAARRTYILYGLNALVIVAAAAYLPFVGAELAHVTGLGTTFVGSLFIATSTSLPEIVVSVSAVRLGAIDMAFGNLLGSNLFNLVILAIDDVFYVKGELLADVSQSHLIVGLAALTMTTLVIIGLIYRATSKRLPLAWDALGIVALYAGTVVLLAAMR